MTEYITASAFSDDNCIIYREIHTGVTGESYYINVNTGEIYVPEKIIHEL